MQHPDKTWRTLALLVYALANWLMAGMAEAATTEVGKTEVGKIVLVVGEAKVTGKAVKAGDSVPVGARITTGADGYLYLKTIDNGFLILRPGSIAIVEAYKVDHANPSQSRFKFTLQQGVARSISGEAVGKARKNFRFNTPVAAIGVRGTDFSVFANAEETRIAVVSGGVVVSGFDGQCLPQGSGPCEGKGSLELFAGTLGILQVQKGQAPLLIEDRSISPDIIAPPLGEEPAVPEATGAAQESKEEVKTNLPADRQEVSLDPLKQEQLHPVLWGRWQKISEELPATIDIGKLDKEIYGMITLPDNPYILLWNKSAASILTLPAEGSVRFNLQGGQAHISEAQGQFQEASINNGRLYVNFDRSTFSTWIGLSAAGENHSLYASGNVTADGVFNNQSQSQLQGNMQVKGALFQGGQGKELQDMTSSYIFQSNLGGGKTVSGVTAWDKPVRP